MNKHDSLPTVSHGSFSRTFARLNDHLSVQEKINFARHLAMVIKAGLPVYEGLRIIRAQTTSRTLMRVLDQLMTDVNNGRFLADSLENFKHLFGDFFINIIRVGEASGTLAQNLAYLSNELKKAKDLQSKVRSAMVYPMVILVMTISVTAFLAFYIMPKLIPVLLGLNVKLPATTVALLATVDFLQRFGIYVLVGLIIFYMVLRLCVRKIKPLRYLLHKITFFLPITAEFVISVNMVNFTRILGMLLKSGVKIVEAITITTNTFDNLVYRDLLTQANEEIKKGGQLMTVLSQKKRYFPVLVSGMIQVGENTGNLEDNLFYLSEYYDDELSNRLQNLTAILEPVMLLIMSMVVGFVAISIITPIYSMSQGVR